MHTLPGRYSYTLYMICNVGCSILRRSLDHVNIRNASCIDIGARGLSHESGVNESDGRRRWKRKVGNVQDVCSESNLIVKERILKHLTIYRNYGNVTVKHKEPTMGVYISNFLDFPQQYCCMF